MIKVKFNPLLQRNFEEIKDDDESSTGELRTIPRTFLRMPSLSYLLEKNERQVYMHFRATKEMIGIEPEAAEREKVLRKLFRYRKIHRWKRGAKIILKSEQTPLTDKGLSIIGSEIFHEFSQAMIFLRACPKVTNYGMESFAEKISRSNPHLNHVGMGFIQCDNINDEGVEVAAKELARHLIDLKSMTLKFSGCENITDNGFIPLVHAFTKYFSRLQQLVLYFDLVHKVTSDGLLAFGHGIQVHQFRELRHLRLGFGGCNGIGDDGIEGLHFQLAKHLPKLQILALNYYDCNQLTDRSPEALGKSFKGNLDSLRNLLICFDNCKKITVKGAESLASDIAKYLPKLQILTLSFFDCDMTDECSGQLYGLLSSIPRVKIVLKSAY